MNAEPGLKGTELLPRTTVTEVCSWRDAALSRMQEAAELLERGFQAAVDAQRIAAHAHGGAAFTLVDRRAQDHYRQLFVDFDGAKSLDVYRQDLDARVWQNLMHLTGVIHMMDRTAKEQLDEDLCHNVPEVTEDNVQHTFKRLFGDAKLIFQRGLARAFSDLDRRFKSHDGFKLGSRIVLRWVFDSFGHLNHSSRQADTLADVQRVFAVLDGQKSPDSSALLREIQQSRGHGWEARQSLTETEFFKVRTFKNGNTHLWFVRDDLVEKANQVLAEYYGEVLPDGVPGEVSEYDLVQNKALAKDLSFYPTPASVVERLLEEVYLGEDAVVLEPSAGAGSIVHGLLARGAREVHAVEVHPDRVEALERIRDPRLKVTAANFLKLPPKAIYTHVLMNPPFFRTHWMEHVMHAYEFLAPGGILLAVLPVTAELGDTVQHEAFRQWARARGREYGRLFQDLPAESFASSGTRVNTVVLSLYRGK